ncbi:unnamed protein product (macronuclear) [Paramecium tetraurelia]|uniref:Uncharacterized protein n=1 Tax=Paramecium tetraurelia TaxID=5888 RepID=A0CNZ9_PARTE|nr:uncharacterized protein GSPATT00038785001 [Paramecium tetraurelia]CAK72516.1 unnamed protein product [Paramecium tetraurelia]|eukprot:XP_001439913.1 hypothetical protein (macronuclear) [Paramecium tetraurelia strain d4-2]
MITSIHKLKNVVFWRIYILLKSLLITAIDIQSVNVIINFDFPLTVEIYLRSIVISGR